MSGKGEGSKISKYKRNGYHRFGNRKRNQEMWPEQMRSLYRWSLTFITCKLQAGVVNKFKKNLGAVLYVIWIADHEKY